MCVCLVVGCMCKYQYSMLIQLDDVSCLAMQITVSHLRTKVGLRFRSKQDKNGD